MIAKYTLVGTVAIMFLGASSYANGALAIYEPFDYTAASVLNAKSGTSEVGFSAAWSAGASTLVGTGTLSYGSLAVTGNRFQGSSNLNRYGGSRSISASTLAGAGLLADGTELWFSAIVGLVAGANGTNHFLSMALSSDNFNVNNGNTDFSIQNSGQGVGFYMKSGVVRAANYTSATAAPTTSSTATAYNAVTGSSGLIVGKIVWGADTDTITIYQPDASLVLGTAKSTVSTTVTQSAFDTLTFRWGDPVLLDEIRFGASAADVMPLAIPEPSTALLGALGALALLRRRRN
jgi:hypothetical protein